MFFFFHITRNTNFYLFVVFVNNINLCDYYTNECHTLRIHTVRTARGLSLIDTRLFEVLLWPHPAVYAMRQGISYDYDLCILCERAFGYVPSVYTQMVCCCLHQSTQIRLRLNS